MQPNDLQEWRHRNDSFTRAIGICYVDHPVSVGRHSKTYLLSSFLFVVAPFAAVCTTFSSGRKRCQGCVQKLKQLPQWMHLDESIVDEIARVPRGGPRVNISVEAVLPDGKPVAGALVVLFESASALINAVTLSHEHPDMRWLQLPLDASLTTGCVHCEASYRTRRFETEYLGWLALCSLNKVERLSSIVQHASRSSTAQSLKETSLAICWFLSGNVAWRSLNN